MKGSLDPKEIATHRSKTAILKNSILSRGDVPPTPTPTPNPHPNSREHVVTPRHVSVVTDRGGDKTGQSGVAAALAVQKLGLMARIHRPKASLP